MVYDEPLQTKKRTSYSDSYFNRFIKLHESKTMYLEF